jgi:type IV pilus assembly protein PilA
MLHMLRVLGAKREAHDGFTLIELLVVMVIIGILASIAIPMFMQQRQKGQDAAAMSLVRNAMTVIESAYVEAKTYDPTQDGMLPADLHAIERPITFVPLDAAATSPTAVAAESTVNYTGDEKTFAVGVTSASGTSFGVVFDQEVGAAYYTAGEVQNW